MNIDLPYKAEYSKSSRASCRSCKTTIDAGVLRMAIMVQSRHFDGKQPNWFHFDCFFKKQHPTTEGDIDNFLNLRPSDQKLIRDKIEAGGRSSIVLPSDGKKGKKRSKKDGDTQNFGAAIKDFGVEYSKSSRANCAGCQQKIVKDEVRIKKTVYDTEVGMKFGGQALWHHVECFNKCRDTLGWFESGDKLPGFNSLSKDDKDMIKKSLPAIKLEDIPEVKKSKLELKTEEDKKLDEQIEKQTKILFKFRDNIETQMKKNEVKELLEYNNQIPQADKNELYDMTSDMLLFGALKRCEKCDGQFIFSRSGYICTGELEWSKCSNFIKEPKRVECCIPSHLKEKYAFLNSYKCKISNRLIKYIPPSAKTISSQIPMKKEDELDGAIDGPKVKREKPPLYNFPIVLIGIKEDDKLKKKIAKLGAKIVSKITEQTMFIVSTAEEIERMGTRMKQAKNLGIHVVPLDYFDAVTENPTGAIQLIITKSLCDWGTDPNRRLPAEETVDQKSKSIYTKSVAKSMKLKLKGGLAVDPDSGLEDVAHVYVDGKTKYNVVLGLTDIVKNKNSYYKMQILESDHKKKYWLFRSWGRIGTVIGGSVCDPYPSCEDAVEKFEELYEEKTGNHFSNHHNFVKRPGRMYPIDIDYGESDKNPINQESKIKSKLPIQVQDLIKLIFDVETMKKVLLEFELDTEKMPLGKLSKKQIQSAYKVLTEISELIQNGGTNAQFIDCTNRFYTLIPHSFGVNNPPILDTTEQIKHHSEMLDSLLEIECAYSMLSSEKPDDNVNPIDQHYAQLKTEIVPLDKNSEEFKLIEKYVQNTHAETHRSYDLEVVDVFKIDRKGELRRYKPFKKLHNRKLLWHGSRLTNYAGILSHGLKIAPPEAPSTGYMFGKGIYFADMVSKSANYCFTSKNNSTGLVLLSEVALGDMLEYTQAHYVTKLPNNKHSVKGIGQTQPDPKESIIRKDGVEIPLGKPIKDDKLRSSLLYNEYIVYDIAQVNIQYLLRLNFKYKY